jgi:hypothetical protein
MLALLNFGRRGTGPEGQSQARGEPHEPLT